MFNLRKIAGGGPGDDKGGGRFLCTAVLLAFMLTAGFFLSACGGGGSTGDPTPGPGNGGPAVTVSFGAASYSAAEGGTAATVAVTLSADPERSVVIPFTVTGTAQSADYTLQPATTSVTFASGETSKNITLTAVDDTADEQNETVILTFGTLPDRVTAGTPSSTTVTITDNDDPPPPAVTVSFGADSYSAAEGGAAATVAVTLSADPERSVTIPVIVDSATSTAAVTEDYSPLPASVTFTSGQTSQNITLAATDNDEFEDDETVVLGFGTLPEGVTPGAMSSTTVTIADNDDPPVTVTAWFDTPLDAYTLKEGLQGDLNIYLSEDPQRRVTIPLAVTGTASAGDYSVPATVTFASGDTTKSFIFTATDDTVNEENETAVIGFGTLPRGVTAEMPSSFTITILDNDRPPDFPDSCDDTGAIAVTANYDATTADPDPDPDGEGLFICGNDTDNVIKGGDADDIIMGGDGADTLQGREGDDEIHGGPGVDTVIYRTTDEDDNSDLADLKISLANDRIEGVNDDGHGGMDTLSGIENVECAGGRTSPATYLATIAGDSGDNRISCEGSPNNLFFGRQGNDTFVYSYGENYYDGSAGTDTLDFSGLSGISGTLTVALNLIDDGSHDAFGSDVFINYGKIATLTDSSGNTHETFAKLASDVTLKGQGQVNIENIIGSSFADDLTGHDGSNRIEGRGGNDVLRGMGGDDEFRGGAGNNTFHGGAGNDTFYANFSSTEKDTIHESAGEGDNDIVRYNDGRLYDDGVNHAAGETTPANVEVVYGTRHADTIRAANTGVTIYGGPHNKDTLYGGTGNDTLHGGKETYGDEDDTFYGGAGDDTFYAHSDEIDTLNDSGGNDTLYYTDTSALAHGKTWAEKDNNGPTPPNIETVYGTTGNDDIRARGGGVTIVGGPGDDELFGGDGKDILVGCGGKNIYYSQQGGMGCPNCAYAAQDTTGNDFYVTFGGGSGDDQILNFDDADNDTLYLMNFAGDHDDLVITFHGGPNLRQFRISTPGNSKRVIVQAEDKMKAETLVTKFQDKDSGKLVIMSSDHSSCGNIK